jgi:hypothetical protein
MLANDKRGFGLAHVGRHIWPDSWPMKKPQRLDPAAQERSLTALALSRREGTSLSRASRLTRTTPRTVLRYAGSGFRKDGRRYRPTAFDRIPREMTVLTDRGPESVTVRDSRTASLLAEHANATKAYRDTGDTSGLRRLRKREAQISGRRLRLVTDADVLDRLIAGAELHYELYRR